MRVRGFPLAEIVSTAGTTTRLTNNLLARVSLYVRLRIYRACPTRFCDDAGVAGMRAEHFGDHEKRSIGERGLAALEQFVDGLDHRRWHLLFDLTQRALTTSEHLAVRRLVDRNVPTDHREHDRGSQRVDVYGSATTLIDVQQRRREISQQCGHCVGFRQCNGLFGDRQRRALLEHGGQRNTSTRALRMRSKVDRSLCALRAALCCLLDLYATTRNALRLRDSGSSLNAA